MDNEQNKKKCHPLDSTQYSVSHFSYKNNSHLYATHHSQETTTLKVLRGKCGTVVIIVSVNLAHSFTASSLNSNFDSMAPVWRT
jgi:uncharacterized membrane-anchored protein